MRYKLFEWDINVTPIASKKISGGSCKAADDREEKERER